jgi:hypothetical protein
MKPIGRHSLGLSFAAAVLAAAPVLAHHATTMFDRSKEASVTGTVRTFSWANPHVRVEIVEDAGGAPGELWNIEGPTPNALIPIGWKRTSLRPGDKVTIKYNPMRDGSHAGLLTGAVLADGTVLSESAKRDAK